MGQFQVICLFASLAALQAASVDVQTCRVDGKIYKNSERFVTGIDGCAKCACIDGNVKCDALKCQEDALNAVKIDKNSECFMTGIDGWAECDGLKSQVVPGVTDYANIKNQLVKQYFSQFDPNRLKIIKNKLGCKTTDCPQLIDACKIDYTVSSLDRQEYVGRTGKQNKTVIHSTDTQAVNNSPSKQVVQTVGYSIKVMQSIEATVSKTMEISSSVGISIIFFNFQAGFRFARTTSETKRTSKETTTNAPSQQVVVDPYTKMNVNFNFYQYDDINNYFLDFVIGKFSTITYPDVIFNSVILRKSSLHEFLNKNVEFLSTMKYANDTDIKLVARDGKFVLKNLPATERFSNFGVDINFGKPEPIPH